MNNSLRLLLIAAFMGLSVAACSDQEQAAETATPAETAVEAPAAAPAPEAKEEATDTTVAAGMTEAEVIAKLGDPSYTETRSLDALKITHSEWTTDSGTTSVQFHNDVVAFSQFVPAAK